MNLLDLFESANSNDCHLCNGTGEGLFDGEDCPVCNGTGIKPSRDGDYDGPEPDDDYVDDAGDEESYYEKSLRVRGLGEQGVAEGSLEEDKGMKQYWAFKREWRAKHGANAKVPSYDSKEYNAYCWRQGDKQQGVAEAQWWPDREYIPKAPRKRKPQVGNRMSDMAVGSPKIVHKNGKAVGEIGLDHDPSPGQGPYYMKHYETNTWYSGYDTKQEALADLKHVVAQMNEQSIKEGSGNLGSQIKTAYQKIYDQGDDAVEFAYNDSPIFAQYWDEYEGDLDSIIAEVDPSELQVIYSELASAAEDQGLAEAVKKKDDPTRDVGLRRAFTKARGAFPTASSDIEALAKDLLQSQDQDRQDFEKIRAVDREQEKMLAQIAQVDQNQTQEIDDLEQDNSTLKRRLQQMQAVNSRLETMLATMSGRKKTKSKEPSIDAGTSTTSVSVPDAPASISKPKVKDQPAKPTTSKAISSVAKSLSGPSSSPAFDRMSQELQPRQKELGFDEPDVLGTVVKPGKKFNTSQATDVVPRLPRDIVKDIGKNIGPYGARLAGSGKTFNPDAVRNLAGQEEMPLENKGSKSERPEANYGDEYQDMVARVGQKARKQEQSKPVDIADLARRLAAIDASRKD